MQRTTMNILSNIDLSGLIPDEIQTSLLSARPQGVRRIAYLLGKARRAHKFAAIFLDCAAGDTIIFCLALRMLPFKRSKLIVADLVLRAPTASRYRLAARVKRWLLRRVDLFILYHRHFDGYTRWYGIEAARVAYLPFKVNSLDLIESLEPTEGDYIFSTGLSLRDWTTLARAMRGIDVPLVICIPSDNFIRREGLATDLPRPEDFGRNLRIVRDDGTPDSWLRLMAGAKFVVLPIAASSIAASGISTYLCAMALRKCVIITEGPATLGILDASNSVVVPASDAVALREAIRKVDGDTAFRNRIAERGRAYARNCGDTNRLYRDFALTVLGVVRGQRADLDAMKTQISGRVQ